jgi:CRP/FNR family transcriptional regulator, cyclic AMP receptor protein
VRRGSNSKVDLLGTVPLFAGLSKRHLQQVARIADEIDLREGKELISEGYSGREFFILLDGSAEVRRKGRKVNIMSPGDFFGEIALLSDRLTTATVTTTEPSRALVITRASFKSLLRDEPAVQLKVLQALADRVPQD